MDSLLAAECKAAMASALEQAAAISEEYERRIVEDFNSLTGLELRVHQQIRALSPDPDYIALREADARIAEANALYTNWNVDKSIRNFDAWFRKHIAALTEARDKLVKK